MTAAFTEAAFRSALDDALQVVRTVLETNKHPQRPADTPHVYEDKYALVEQAARGASVAALHALDALGASGESFKSMAAWAAAQQSVSLRLHSTETCSFVKKVEREEESKTTHVDEYENSEGRKSKWKSGTVTKITEYIWKFDVEYELIAFCGSDPDQRVVLQTRAGSTEIVTSSDKSPRPEAKVVHPVSVNVTWLFERLPAKATDANLVEIGFAIDRSVESCRTPRRNADVESALRQFDALHAWAGRVCDYFRADVFPAQSLEKFDMNALHDRGVFVPVVPLMLPPTGDAKAGALLPAADQLKFIAEQRRSLDEKLTALSKAFPESKQLVSGAEANIIAVAMHLQSICNRFSHCVDYVEFMLEQQLIAAVGKVLTPQDFGEYMQFHARRLFAAAYAPKPFVYAIRRRDHCPEGTLTIEADDNSGATEQPMQSIVAAGKAHAPMFFSLGAATRAAFTGERYLHGMILHQFSHQTDVSLRLTARARQFSSFILMVGKIASADTFEPTHSIIVQNKDDVLVPLLLEQIPSAKAFRDAIESLSPEQQRFAKAFRAMQLESTLFGVCVVEIKPQLERLLKLPADALTKEIRLTQDLMELFITYQVPSDLLSYDGDELVSLQGKLDCVKKHVKALQDMIAESKKKELEERQQEARCTVADSIAESAPPYRQSGNGGGGPGRMPGRGGPLAGGMAPMMAMRRGPMRPTATASPAAAAPPPPPKATAPQKESAPLRNEPAPKKPKIEGAAEADDFVDDEAEVDYTKVPAQLDAQFDKLDKEGAVRPTKLEPATVWRKKFQKALLAKPDELSLGKDELREQKNQAFDLLDALTKSGALTIEQCQLHVVIVSTHCFDKTLIKTVVQDNVNPIEKVERTQLIIGAVVHGVSPAELVRENQLERVKEFNASLFDEGQ